MADDTEADDDANGQDHLDDAQAGKNTDLRHRATASQLASDERNETYQPLLARSRRGRDMTPDATDQSKQVGGFAKSRSQKWYDGQ